MGGFYSFPNASSHRVNRQNLTGACGDCVSATILQKSFFGVSGTILKTISGALTSTSKTVRSIFVHKDAQCDAEIKLAKSTNRKIQLSSIASVKRGTAVSLFKKSLGSVSGATSRFKALFKTLVAYMSTSESRRSSISSAKKATVNASAVTQKIKSLFVYLSGAVNLITIKLSAISVMKKTGASISVLFDRAVFIIPVLYYKALATIAYIGGSTMSKSISITKQQSLLSAEYVTRAMDTSKSTSLFIESIVLRTTSLIKTIQATLFSFQVKGIEKAVSVYVSVVEIMSRVIYSTAMQLKIYAVVLYRNIGSTIKRRITRISKTQVNIAKSPIERNIISTIKTRVKKSTIE